MEWLQYWYALPVAVAVSTIAMFSGVGGGLIFAPFFLFFLKLSPGQALGTSLLTQVFGMGTGFLNYYKMKLTDYKTGFMLLTASIPGAILGSVLINLKLVDVFYLKLLFGATIFLMALMMAFHNGTRVSSQPESPQGRKRELTDSNGNTYLYWISGPVKTVLTSFLAGIGVGTVAIGSGELNTPRLIASGVPTKIAIPTSVFVMAVTVFSATLIYAANGQFLMPLAMYTCSGGMIGAKLGTVLVHKVSEKIIKRVLSVLFTIVGLFILAQTLM